MYNRRAFVTLAAGAAGLAACGRQVTPNPTTNDNLAGKMVIRFRVRGTLDFNNINYVIAFNTSGVGGEPYPKFYLTSYTDFSYAFAIGANYGGAGVTLPSLFQYIETPDAGLNPRAVPLGASTTQLIPQDSIAQNEFQLTFTREQLDNPLQFQTATPAGANATATPTPTLTPAANPSASPTATPTAVPSGFAPTVTPIPNAQPTTNSQRYWFINFFTLDRSGTPLDSLGIGGPTDSSFTLAIDTSRTNLNGVFRPSGILAPPSNLSAYIDGGEVDNYV